jgi:hypothetical protein
MFRCSALFLLLLCLAATARSGDTVFIRSVSVQPDITSYNIKGALVKVYCSFTSRTTPQPDLVSFSGLLHKDQQPVMTTLQQSAYADSNGRARTPVEVSYSFDDNYTLHFFIPYYILRLPAGQHTLQLSLQAATYRYATKQYSPLVISGQQRIAVGISKPATHNFSIACTTLVASKRDVATYWDPNNSGPDLYYQIILDNDERSDIVFTSSVCDNGKNCNWQKFCPTLTLSDGDLITIAVFDQDRISRDDLVGLKRFTLAELKALAQPGKTIEFNQVLAFGLLLR